MTVLVVGGNGQLGAACCAELLDRGQQVRASVRSAERGALLEPASFACPVHGVVAGSGRFVVAAPRRCAGPGHPAPLTSPDPRCSPGATLLAPSKVCCAGGSGVVSTPAAVYAAAARVLAPVAEVPSRAMALNRYVASAPSPWPDAGGGLVAPATMTTVEQFLRGKAALPADLSTVV